MLAIRGIDGTRARTATRNSQPQIKCKGSNYCVNVWRYVNLDDQYLSLRTALFWAITQHLVVKFLTDVSRKCISPTLKGRNSP